MVTDRYGFTAVETRRLRVYTVAFLTGGTGLVAAEVWAVTHPSALSGAAILLGAVASASSAAGLVRLVRTARLRMATETAQAARARRGTRAA